MVFIKTVSYPNYYSKKEETISLKWTIEEGFCKLEDAYEAVKNLGQDPEEFSVVCFMNMFYPVSICTIQKEVLISKNFVWYKNGAYTELKKYRKEDLKELPYRIENTRISSIWAEEMLRSMRSFDPNISCIVAPKAKAKIYLEPDCMILFGGVMFDTLIPVYELNCMDMYFEYPPSRMRLWKEGIKKYNPYNYKKICKNDRTPYTYGEYCADQKISQQ